MTDQFVARLRELMRTNGLDLIPGVTLEDDVIRLGRRARRRRALALAGTAAAALLVAALVTSLIARPAPDNQPIGPSSSRPTTSTDRTAPPTRTPSAPPPGAATFGVLDANNTIHHDGKRIRVPAPPGQRAVAAQGVNGGWVVRLSAGELEPHHIVLVTNDARIREFDPRLQSGIVAVEAGGARMAAIVHPYLYVFELPSMATQTRIDVRGRNGGAQVDGLWLVGERIVVRYATLETSGHDGVVVWNTANGTETASPAVRPEAVSADGSTVALRRSAPGDAPDCVAVVPLADQVPATGPTFCEDGQRLSIQGISPDGEWLAVSVNPTPESTAVWFYRIRELQTGNATPFRFEDRSAGGHLRFEGWLDANRAVVAEEHLRLVAVCRPEAARCDLQSVPPTSTSLVLAA